MPALERDFNYPKTAAIQLVNVSGKIDDEATYFVTIALEISDDDTRQIRDIVMWQKSIRGQLILPKHLIQFIWQLFLN